MSKKTLIRVKRAFIDGEIESILGIEIEDHLISKVIYDKDPDSSSYEKVYEFNSLTAVAGFIDIQVNGGNGHLVNPQISNVELELIRQAHLKNGTTSILPTLITCDERGIQTFIECFNANYYANPGILGFHLEGPLISTVRRGIHSLKSIRSSLSSATVSSLKLSAKLCSVIVTLAPEVSGIKLIEELSESEIIVGVSHTRASYELGVKAVRAGAKLGTHIFNAMTEIHSRDPGIVLAMLENNEFFVSLIADGHHLHPSILKMTIDLKTRARALFVSDSMPFVGSDLERFELENGFLEKQGNSLLFYEIEGARNVKENSNVKLEKHGNNSSRRDEVGRKSEDIFNARLGGTLITMIDAVRYAVNEVGIDLVVALEMATSTPAVLLGIEDEVGRIRIRNRADLVFLDEKLNVKHVFSYGKEIF